MKKKLICLILGVMVLSQSNLVITKADTLKEIGQASTLQMNTISVTGDQIVTEAKYHLNKPYVWGGKGPSYFDCSGFTSYVYKQSGIYIPSYISSSTGSESQRGYGTKVSSISDLRVGDLVITNNYNHVGIYVGNNQYINAQGDDNPNRNTLGLAYKVVISNITGFNEGRRIVQDSGVNTSLWRTDIGIVDGAVIALKPGAIQGLGSKSPYAGFPETWHLPTTHQVKYQAIISGSHELAINDTWVPINWVTGVNNTKVYYPTPKDRTPVFSEKFYLANNKDVAEAVKAGQFVSGYSHYLQNGKREGRSALPKIPQGFNETNYLKLNQDVVKAGYTSALAHYLSYGYDENRLW